MIKRKLSTMAARTDLTDREASKLLGSLIGGLLDMAPVEEVRNAVRWWAENDEAWAYMEKMQEANARDGGGS